MRDDLALRLLAQGVGLAIAPQSIATSEVAVLTVSDLNLARMVGFVWRTDLPDAHREACSLPHRIDAALAFGSLR